MKLPREAELPTVSEIVDSTEEIDAFIPYLDEVIQEGLVTRERANVIFYRHGAPPEELVLLVAWKRPAQFKINPMVSALPGALQVSRTLTTVS